MRPKCPCGWFLAEIQVLVKGDCIHEVTGLCKRHGEVVAAPGDWGWDDLFGEDD